MVLVFFLMSLVFSAIIMFLFVISGQAEVGKESNRMFENLNRLHVEKKVRRIDPAKQERTFCISCRNLINVKFGINNYFQDETPLNS